MDVPILDTKRTSDLNISTGRNTIDAIFDTRHNSVTSLSRYSTNYHKKKQMHASEEYQDKLNAQKRLDTLRNNEIKIKNRVNLLENEEKRILKKVEETRARAAKMKTIKEENE